MEDAPYPETLIEALDYFRSHENCHNFLVALRWPDGVRCPHCGSPVVHYMPSVRRWQCYEKHPRAQFSLKTGTIFEESPVTLRKWLAALSVTAVSDRSVRLGAEGERSSRPRHQGGSNHA